MMANLRKAVSFIVSHPPNKIKGTFTVPSPFVLSLRKTSFVLEVGTPKTELAPFYSTSCLNHTKLLNLFRDNAQKDCEQFPVVDANRIEWYCKFGQIEIAIASLRKRVQMGLKTKIATYTTVFDSLVSMGRDECALKLLKEMAFHQGIVPDDAFTYGSLLHVIRISCRRDDISKMLKDMEGEGIYLDPKTFNIFVDAYCKEGRMEDAESLAKLMIQRKIGPNIVTYRWLIDGYCMQGNMSKSMQVLDSMRCRGVVPNVAIYNSLINGYCKVSKIEEAMHLFDEMMKNGVKRGAITYDTMGLFRVGDCVPEEILCNEVPIPKESTFKLVLEGLCNNNRVEEAVSLFRSMLNSNIDLYNILIDGASKSGKVGIARILYKELLTTTKGLQPNAATYAAMINGFCQEDGLAAGEAKELFLEMKQKGFLPNNVSCNLLLRGFAKNHQHDIVEMLTQEMLARGFKFDVSTFLLMIQKKKLVDSL